MSSEIAGMCRCKVILEFFEESTADFVYESICCCFCESCKSEFFSDAQEEIKLVLEAVNDLPGFGEVKVIDFLPFIVIKIYSICIHR